MDHLKPLYKSSAIPVLQSIQGTALTSAADELILAGAQILSEGEITSETENEYVYNGSTLITIELDRSDLILGPAREDFSQLIKMLSASILFRLRLMRIARMETERRCVPYLLREMSIQTEFKIEDKKLFVDIYIECPLAMTAARKSSPKKGKA